MSPPPADPLEQAGFCRRLCINLARRSDRWEQVQSEFLAHGIRRVGRYEALDGAQLDIPGGWRYSAGAYGCLRSHTAVVEEARRRNDGSILIFEDDVVLHPGFARNFVHRLANVPPDWDALYLGGIHEADPVPVAPGVARLSNTNSTYAYALRSTLYDAFLERAGNALVPVDEILRNLQPHFRFYCFMPHLAWVRQDHSDILGAEVNHWWLEHSLVLTGQVLERATVVLRDVKANGAAPNAKLFHHAMKHYSEMGMAVQRLNGAAIRGQEDYIVIMDYDILVLPWEFQASLMKCQEYDRVLPLYDPIALSQEDTIKMLAGREDEVDTAVYPRSQTADRESFVIYSAAAWRGGNSSCMRTFESPSRLLRLYGNA